MPQVTEEQLKKMSPEQIAELQKKQCVFCKIIKGEISAKKVYEDEECIAVMDINPANPGHLLIIPKEHYQIMPQIPEYTVERLFMVSKALTQATLKALKSQGTTIFAANGMAAGQKAPHFLVHVIPRFEGDNLPLQVPEREISEAELQNIKKEITPRIKQALGSGKKIINLDEEPEKIKAEHEEAKEKPDKKKAKKKETKKKKPKKSKADLDKITEMLADG